MLHCDLIFLCAKSLLGREVLPGAAQRRKENTKFYNYSSFAFFKSQSGIHAPTPTFFFYYSVKCRYITGRKFPVNKESPPYTSPPFPNASVLMGINLDTDKGDKRRVKKHRGTIQAIWRFYEQCYYLIRELLPLPFGLLHAHWH